MYSPSTPQNSKIIWVRCILLNLRSCTSERASLLLLTKMYYYELGGMVNFTLLFMTNDMISISTSQTFCSRVVISIFTCLWRFISQLTRYARDCASYECFIQRVIRLSSKQLNQGYLVERLKSSWGRFMVDTGSYSAIWCKIWNLPLPKVKWHFDPRTVTVTSQPIGLHQLHDLDTEFDVHRCNMPARNVYPSRLLVPSFGTCLCSNCGDQFLSNMPCIFSTFYLECPSILSRFC